MDIIFGRSLQDFLRPNLQLHNQHLTMVLNDLLLFIGYSIFFAFRRAWKCGQET